MVQITPNEELETLLAELRYGVEASVSPHLFAQKLKMELPQLAELAHISPEKIEQSPISAELQNYLQNAIRVLIAVTELNGRMGQSVFWFRTQLLQPFDNKTPEMLVSEGETEKVLKYIAMLNVGPTG